MIRPSYEEFKTLARLGHVVPISREILADLETPVSAFLKIHRGGPGFLLESVQGGETWGRYSFLGTEPAELWSARGREIEIRSRDGRVERQSVPDTLNALRDRLARWRPAPMPGLPRFTGGAVGALAYDLVREFERLPEKERDAADLELPDARLLFADRLIVFDNVAQRIRLIANARLEEGISPRKAYDDAVTALDDWLARLAAPLPARPMRTAPPAPFEVRAGLTQREYEQMVERAKEYVCAGDVIQVVLAQRFEAKLRSAPFDVYRALRSVNPSPYLFFLDLGDHQLAGASPEVMVRVEGRQVTVRPIAGTRPRGTSEHDDRALEAELATDPKEVAEHIMLVDLGRNDIGRIAKVGSVAVTERMVVERYSHVMHLVSNVRGELAAGQDAFDAFRATFPAGTLSGAPKIRAMEIIDELEPVRRGFYGGAVGYFGFSGAMDTGITIRTVLIQGDRVYVQAGAGIVADSVPELEHLECLNKARGVIQALELAETL